MKQTASPDKIRYIFAMSIFGTIGIFRRSIPFPSSIIALSRGIIGTIFLLLVYLATKRKINRSSIRKNLIPLLFSGMAIGFNWILLFEAYCYTSVATATLCYYMAPIFLILAAPIVTRERLTRKQLVCALAALCGMIPVSGLWGASAIEPDEFKGIVFGICAAILYAGVVLINKKIDGVDSFDKTILQLFFASVTLLPYVLITEKGATLPIAGAAVGSLLFVGIVHTGLAYWLYFSSIEKLKSHTVALWSYLDPVVAIILSAFLLKESMEPAAWAGAVLILGAAYISDRS